MYKIDVDTVLSKGKRVLSIGVFATTASFLYVWMTGCYNGDFTGIYANPEPFMLIGIYIITLLPYIFIWIFFRKYTYKFLINYQFHKNPVKSLRNITWIMILISIFLSIIDYGRLGQGETSMSLSNPISVVQAILYKFTRFPWVTVFLLLTNNKKSVYITIVLCIVSSIIRLSLGGIMAIALLLLFKYDNIIKLIKRHIVITTLIVFLLPNIISGLYNLRTQLRHGVDMQEMTSSSLIFDKLCGRISSYSNNAITLQNIPYIIAIRDQYPDMYLFYDSFKFFGVHHDKFKSIGNVMQREIVGSSDENYSTMSGFGGLIAFSIVKSPLILILNIALVIFLLWLTFFVPYKLKLPCPYGVGLLCSIGFCMSCDTGELTVAIFGLFIIALYIRYISKIKINS